MQAHIRQWQEVLDLDDLQIAAPSAQSAKPNWLTHWIRSESGNAYPQTEDLSFTVH